MPISVTKAHSPWYGGQLHISFPFYIVNKIFVSQTPFYWVVFKMTRVDYLVKAFLVSQLNVSFIPHNLRLHVLSYGEFMALNSLYAVYHRQLHTQKAQPQPLMFIHAVRHSPYGEIQIIQHVVEALKIVAIMQKNLSQARYFPNATLFL